MRVEEQATSLNGAGAPATSGPTVSVVALAQVSHLSARTRSFHAALRGKSSAPQRQRLDARISFNLNVAANVRFTLKLALSGQKAGKRCPAARHKTRRSQRCIRYVRQTSFTTHGRAGMNQFWLAKHLRHGRLVAGRFQLIATPTSSGEVGWTRTITFTEPS
jgi:hypothetical protein